MPFTPFHFGPGLVFKAMSPNRFWLTSFLAANVLIDVEVLYYMWHDDPPLHRHLHSYLGGTVVGLVAGLGMFAAVPVFSKVWNHLLRKSPAATRSSSANLLAQSLVAGFVGGVTHVFLDSLMHRDMHPFWPLLEPNTLAGTVSVGSLHIGLAIAGLFGGFLWLMLDS